MRLAAAFVVALVVFGALQLAPPAASAAEATIVSTSIKNQHPKDLIWSVAATAPVDITDLTLHYRLRGTKSTSIGKPESFTPGTSINTTVRVETDPNGDWIPVGAEFTWQWEFTLADGTTSQSKEDVFVYLPTNHTWQTLKTPLLTVHYFGERSSLVNQFVTAGEEVAQKIGKELLNTQIEDLPVTVVLLGNAQEVAANEPSKGSTFDRQRNVVVCGFRPSQLNNLVIGTISCGGSDPVDTFRHEFGHVVTKSAGESSLVKVPSWLDEGIAITSQKNSGEYMAAFNASLRAKKDIFAFSQMLSYPADPNQTLAWYGQSYAMTQYLIQKYGAAKMAQYFAAMKAGTRADVALQQVFGVDQRAFEDGFRASVVQGSGQPTATPRQQQQQQQPTRAATPAAQTRPNTAAGNSDDDSPFDTTSLAIIGGSMMFALLAVFSFLVAMMMQNNRQRMGAARVPSPEPPSAPAETPPPGASPPPSLFTGRTAPQREGEAPEGEHPRLEWRRPEDDE